MRPGYPSGGGYPQPGYGSAPGPGGAPGYGQPGYGAPPGAGSYGGPPGYGGAPATGYGQPQPGYGQPQPGYGQPGFASQQSFRPPGPGGAPAPGPGGAPYGQGSQQWGASYYYNQLQGHEIQQLQNFFAAIDRDRSGEISAFELAQTDFGGFKISTDTATMLVKVFDRDRSGQISFNEFASLYKFILSMKQAYLAYDQDRSGSIDSREASLAIQQAGFQLSPQTMEEVFRKFLKPPTAKGLNLEQFIQLSAYLGILRNLFSQFDTNRTGWIQINFDQLVQMNLRSV